MTSCCIKHLYKVIFLARVSSLLEKDISRLLKIFENDSKLRLLAQMCDVSF